MISRLLWCVAMLGLAAWGCNAPPEPETRYIFRGAQVQDTPPAEDFTLLDQNGEPFRLGDARGNIVLLFFGYAHCPDVCPTTLSTWARAERLLGDDAERVRFVFITVDPERDSAERLRSHLAVFSTEFLGLRGTTEELESVYDAYGVEHDKVDFFDSDAGYLVDHTVRMFLIDRDGRVRLKYNFDANASDVANDVRWLLDH